MRRISAQCAAALLLAFLTAGTAPPLPASGAATTLQPGAPAALATGPGEVLYIVDTERDQILRYLPRTGFQVFAGDGKRGFSADGTPALRARLELNWWSGLAVGGDGAVYFTDGNRVRDVPSSNGALETMAGGGNITLGRPAVPALRANLSTGGDGLAGLTFGPGGELYIATGEGVYRLGPDAMLHWVVGEPLPFPPDWGGVYSNPAVQNDFTNAVHLAFDSSGDLFVAGGGGFGLYEKTSKGQLSFVEVLRAQGGAPGSLATAPDGTVVAASGTWGLQWAEPSGRLRLVRADWPQSSGAHHVYFCPCFGDGVAVGTKGQIYVDTDHGDAVPNQGLYEVMPSGRVLPLWEAPD